MKLPQFIVAVILSAMPLILVIILIFMGHTNQGLEAQVQAQQEEINKGAASRQIGVNLLKEIAQASVKDAKLKDVLTRSGYTVTINASPSPSPSPASLFNPAP